MSTQVESASSVHDVDALLSSKSSPDSSESLLRTLWRHKVLVLLSLAAALAVGYWKHRQKPTTYAASTQLMIRSDNPLRLDIDTGNRSGGIPDFDVLSTLVRSDKIIQVAASDPEFAAINAGDLGSIGGRLRGGISFSSQKSSATGPTDRAIATLSFGGNDPDFCVAAVNATARAIEEYFERERAASANGLSSLINRAETKLLPELKQLEDDYRIFRTNAQLAWSADGSVVNPHRERQVMLRAQQVDLENRMRQMNGDLRLIQSTWKNSGDYALVLQIIQQLGGRGDGTALASAANGSRSGNGMPPELMTNPATDDLQTQDLAIRDLELESLQVEQTLMPLVVEEQKLVSELGPSHPAVRSLKTQVEMTRKRLNELAEQRQKRVEELRRESEVEWRERMSQIAGDGDGQNAVEEETRKLQQKYISDYVNAIRQRIGLIQEELNEIRGQTEIEKIEANALAQAETDDAMYNRQIDSVRRMLIQLEEQMAGLNISEVNNGVIVEPLMSSVNPYITGPNFNQDMMMASLFGLGLGGLLAFLIESNARTFRNSEQIAEQLQLPVIAHIPLDEQAMSNKRSEAVGDQAKMHPNLSVVHRPESSTTEAFRCTRTSILFDSNKNQNKVYQVTSPLPGDGKSTIASNLACSLAQSGKKTLLIDLDLRSPRLTGRFGLEDASGMTNLLNGECDPRTAISQTAIPCLDVLPSGSIPSNPAEALLLPEMAEAFDWFRDHYDFIIVDTPPLLLVTDPAITSSYVDATVLAIRIIRRCKPNCQEAVAILRNAGATIVGIAVNKIDEVAIGSYYQVGSNGSYRGVGYGYGKQYRKQRMKSKEMEQYQVLGKSRHPKVENESPKDLDAIDV